MENSPQIVDQLISSLQELKDAKELLNNILIKYDIYRQQFNTFDTLKFPKTGDKSSPKHTWTCEADEMNIKIRKYLKFDDSE